MSPELEQKLIKKYPVIFKDAGKSEMESCMAFGCECNDGWYDIIDSLCEAMTNTFTTSVDINGVYHVFPAPQIVADQIKEKFGTLRFYYHMEYPKEYTELYDKYLADDVNRRKLQEWSDRYYQFFNGIEHYAEILSSRTCEVTGKPGKMHRTTGGWYKTLNEEYAKTEQWCIDRGYKPLESRESN